MGRRVGRMEPNDAMPITITGRHMTVTPALKRYLEQRIQRLKRYGVKLDSGQFVLNIEKYRHTVEGVVVVNGRLVQGKVATQEMYASIDCLLEKLERQLLKNKEKLVARKLRARSESDV
jgi:putative sigma-54 modulation protein